MEKEWKYILKHKKLSESFIERNKDYISMNR